MALGKQKLCLVHWCYNLRLADPRIKAAYTVEQLVALWTGRCAITGLPLIAGENASIDHIVPVAKNGSSTIENLRFIHSGINRFKWDFTDEEFRKVVLAIGPKLVEWAKDLTNKSE